MNDPERDLQPTEDLPERPEQSCDEARQQRMDDLSETLKEIARPMPGAREWVLELNPDETVRHTVKKGDEPWFDDCVHIKVREVL
jgi:hypothetical protein